MEENSGDFSDELDEFEESVDETKQRGNFSSKARNQTFVDKPYDEVYEISQDLSMAESFDGREKVN
jgi:heme oxygenase